MTRRVVLSLILLAIMLIGAKTDHLNLIRLTVINKSGLPVEIRLTGNLEDNSYYLRIQKGYAGSPLTQVFTILPDRYSMQVYYIEPWDPVYGYDCSSKILTVEAYHNTRVVVPVCTINPPNGGEPSMVKFGGGGGKKAGR